MAPRRTRSSLRPRRSTSANSLRIGSTPPSTRFQANTPRLDGLLDRHVLGTVLAPGERSAVFRSASHIQGEYPTGTDISFFYLKVPGPGGGELGRIEVPRWVADDPVLLDRVHATVLQECRKGEGYPLALSEAHERAVVRASEREAFFRLMERRLRRAGLDYAEFAACTQANFDRLFAKAAAWTQAA